MTEITSPYFKPNKLLAPPVIDGLLLYIANSKKLSEARLVKMKARDVCINKIKDETKHALLNPESFNIGADEYKNTLKNLIV